MTTQYGFFIDSSRCTGCKTCELACKDFKNLTPEVSFRRIYEYAGGDWQEDNGVWHQNVYGEGNHLILPGEGWINREYAGLLDSVKNLI